MTNVRTQGAVGYAALWVTDLRRAATFFQTVLGWTYDDPASQHRMLAGAVPPQSIVALAAVPAGIWDGWPRHNTLFLSHAVDDVDAAVERVRAAGGQAEEPTDEPHGRGAQCADDQGMPFAVHAADADSAPGESAPARGELAYLTFEVIDSARARTFFDSVFGWGFTPGSHADGWHIEGLQPMGGVGGGHNQPTIVPMYAVDDVAAAVARVRDAGGRASTPESKPYGTTSDCVDDQGTRFYLGQLA